MIRNPSLLLLDEPTSGLDSHTAFKTTKLIKAEARRGMTMLATIHMPSSQIFLNFDRVIILADGYTIYNGPPKYVVDYFSAKDIYFPLYSNPADFLLKLASVPYLVKE